MIMRHTSHILQTIVLAVALLAAGQSAWAGPYTTSFMEFTGFSRSGGHVVRIQGFINWLPDQAESGTSHVFDAFEFTDRDNKTTLTINGTINLNEADGFTDVTTATDVTLKFESEKFYFSDATVTTTDGTEVTGITVAGGADYRDWIQITIPAGKTFGRINLILDTHLPLKVGATISGIDDVYINDHVNEPDPVVIHQDPGSSAVQLTKGVDYKVSYANNDKAGTATVTVTGMGDYMGSLSKNFTIRDLSLADDFTLLATDTYAITSQQDLDNLAFLVNEGNDCAGITFHQTADITYTDHGKGLPIGMDGKPFRGTYHGQDHIISGLVVDNNGTFDHGEGNPPYDKFRLYSGLFGELDGATVRNVRLISPVIKNMPNVSSYMSGREGMYIIDFLSVVEYVKLWYHSAGIAACIQNGSAVSNCFVYEPAFRFVKLDYSSLLDVFQQASAPVIYASTESAESANAQVFLATAGSNVSFASGSIATGDGFIYGGKRYYKANAAIAVTYSGSAPGDGNRVAFTDGDGNLLSSSGSGSAYLVLMPDRDVTITARILSDSQFTITAQEAKLQGVTGYWATFYHSSSRFTLPEGAHAYTMGSDRKLYRLGTDGKTIPAGVAVVILADKASLTLEKTDDTSPVTINGDGNILCGSDTPVAPSDVTGTPFVLGIVDGRFGFFEYTGTVIPAHKAYYIIIFPG